MMDRRRRAPPGLADMVASRRRNRCNSLCSPKGRPKACLTRRHQGSARPMRETSLLRYVALRRGLGTVFLIASFHSSIDAGALPSRVTMASVQAQQTALMTKPRTWTSLSIVPNVLLHSSQVIPIIAGTRCTRCSLATSLVIPLH